MEAEDHMTEEATFLSRIGKWFKRDQPSDGGGSRLMGEPGQNASTTALETRTTFLRPWAKRDAAIAHLQDGFNTLTDLMGAIRDNLDHQNRRQDELLNALQQLPQVLQGLPESSRVQTETLTAIRAQMEGQSAQQARLGEILHHIGESTSEQRQMVDAIRGRIDELHKNDTSIAEYLNTVGSSLKDVSKTSQTSTQVLEQMRDNIDSRDGQLERVLHRQGVRFTTILSVAIFLSIAALAAVGVLGFLLLNQKPH
jgi:chromosome segregation ATPase